MKNPNGYGSVIKLSGKRRKSFTARITTGYTNEGKQIFKYIGYYETRKEALYQLSLYNNNPYDVDLKNITLGEIYNRFYDIQKNKVGNVRLNSYKTLYNHLKPIETLKMIDIKILQIQTLFDELTQKISTGTLKLLKSFLGQLFRYAMQMEVIEKDYTQFIKLPQHKKVINRNDFSEKEITLLWDNLDYIDGVDIVLILIYTGMRVNELLKLKKENVDICNMILIGGSKTEAGKDRIIPIHPKIAPLITKRLENKTEYLISNKTEDDYYRYSFFRAAIFKNIMDKLDMKHTIHDTRHTFATLISEVSNNESAITGIIGHTNIAMTKKYTHTNIEKMRKEIEKIN